MKTKASSEFEQRRMHFANEIFVVARSKLLCTSSKYFFSCSLFTSLIQKFVSCNDASNEPSFSLSFRLPHTKVFSGTLWKVDHKLRLQIRDTKIKLVVLDTLYQVSPLVSLLLSTLTLLKATSLALLTAQKKHKKKATKKDSINKKRVAAEKKSREYVRDGKFFRFSHVNMMRR